MKKVIVIVISTLSTLCAQQNTDYVQYMFNPVLINPGYAGSQNAMNISGIYRSQWTGIQGAPQAKSLAMHSPLRRRKVNLGLIVQNETMGVFDHSTLSMLYTYRIRTGSNARLALGLQAGIDLASNNWYLIRTRNENDPNFLPDATRQAAPTSGAGVYFDRKNFYAGLSVPQVFITTRFRGYLPVVFHSGYLYDLNEVFKLKPAVLVKYITGSPVSANISATFYYKELFGLGLGHTYHASTMIFADIRINDQLHFGYGFDRPATQLKRYTAGGHEILLRYLFSYKIKAVSARYF